jgi:hypothetical protein
MSYLPSKFSTPVTPVVEFLQKHEPDDRKEAREFRAALMKAINYHLPGDGRWSVTEHPDSMYLEN